MRDVMRLKDSDGSHEQLISWTKNDCQVTAAIFVACLVFFLILFRRFNLYVNSIIGESLCLIS